MIGYLTKAVLLTLILSPLSQATLTGADVQYPQGLAIARGELNIATGKAPVSDILSAPAFSGYDLLTGEYIEFVPSRLDGAALVSFVSLG